MLMWFKKRRYRNLGEVLQALYREISALQPKDSTDIKWVRSNSGMEAHFKGQYTPWSMPQVLSDGRISAKETGHFQIVPFQDGDGDWRIAVVNTACGKPMEEADPSIIRVNYVGNYSTTGQFQQNTISVATWISDKLPKRTELYKVYLRIMFVGGHQYILSFENLNSNAAVDFFLIGTYRFEEDRLVVTQDYKGNSADYNSYMYVGQFKIGYTPSLGWCVMDGNNPDSEIAGIVHVNRQPYGVPGIAVSADVPENIRYIYIKVSVPIRHLPKEIPASAEIVESETPLVSTDEEVYHLIAEIVNIDGAGVIRQIHWGQSPYIEWYGPCLGLLEEKSGS